jgi:CubicO group peptidase (beta-lactamase class C family)
MKAYRLIICAGLSLICASCARDTAMGIRQHQSAIAKVPPLMEEALVPGLQMAIIANGRIDVTPFGIRDVGTGAPVTADTVFEAASLGKPVFAYGMLELEGEAAQLTARQLLSHSGGLGTTPGPGGTFAVERSPTRRFSYSGEGYTLLQKGVERVTGQPLNDYMRAAVFEPLGMTQSGFVWRDDFAEQKAFGHGYTGSTAGRNRISDARAASSLETTAGDYARFLIAAVSGTGLSPEIARQMLQPQVKVEEGCVTCLGRPVGALSETVAWGLGFGLADTAQGRMAWHWGDNQTMQSYAAIATDGSRGVVILTNSANGHSIARELASSVLRVDAPGYGWLVSYGSYREPVRQLVGKIVRRGTDSLTNEDLSVPRPQLLLAAERLIAGRRAADAAALIRRLGGTGPAAAEEYALLAEALRQQRRYDEAREAAQTALRLRPSDERAGQVLERIGQSERVISAEKLARYAGRYSSPFGPLEIRSDGRYLTGQLLDQPPSDMLPLSDTSFLMEGMGVPITFVQGPDGNVTHAVVSAGGEIRLPRTG